MNLTYTVVVPTYNSSSRIEATLNSLLTQDQKPEQVFVVDDCSQDINELKRVVGRRCFFCLNIVVIEKHKKSNAAVSRNIGWEMSESDVVFFLDSDDRWKKNHVSDVLSLFNSDSCDSVISTFSVESAGEISKVGLSTISNTTDYCDYLFLEGNDCRSSTLSVKRELYNRVQFDPLAQKHQDWDFFLRMGNEKCLVQVLDSDSVLIVEEGEHRMSASMNVEASIRFLNLWRHNFEVRHFRYFYIQLITMSILQYNKKNIILINDFFKSNLLNVLPFQSIVFFIIDTVHVKILNIFLKLTLKLKR